MPDRTSESLAAAYLRGCREILDQIEQSQMNALQLVAANPDAIGYCYRSAVTGRVKVVLDLQH